ncbi:MAG: tetratricopeptide repeat protein [Candidatus Glassbacteria bacterium]
MRILDSREFKICAILFSVSLIARFIYLWDISSTLFFRNALVDEYVYNQMAEAILKGLPEPDGVFRSPLYPFFLALCYVVFGQSIAVARVIQMIVGGVCTVLLYRLALYIVERRAAILSALIYSIYWPAIYFQGELLIISILCTLLVLTVHFYIRALRRTGVNRSYLISGLLLGASCLARGTALFFYPVFAFFTLRCGKRGKGTKSLLVFTVATVSLILVSGFRNYFRTGEFVLLSSNGAINFYTGNNIEADGINPISPGLKWNKLIKEPVLVGLRTAGEQSKYWIRKSLDFIAENPSRFLHLYLKKCYAFWNSFEISNNKDIYYIRSLSRFLSAPLLGFGIIGPLSILSLLFIKRGTSHLKVLWALVVVYMLGNAFFFAAARYRMAVVPFIIIIASHAAISLYDTGRRRDWGMVFKSAMVLLAAGLFVNLDPMNLKGSINTRPHFQTGQLYLMQNRYDEAIQEMMKDLKCYPHDPDILNNLGVVYEKKRNFEEAEKFYREALKTGEFSGVRWNLGVLYYEDGKYVEARAELLKALDGDPYNPSIQNGLKLVEKRLSETGG